MIFEDSLSKRVHVLETVREAGGWSGRDPARVVLLQEVLETVTDDVFPGAILPRLVNGRMVYYAVTQTMTEWRTLRPMLRAWVGVTLTDFVGAQATLSNEDKFESLLARYAFRVVSRFSAHGIRRLERATVEALLALRCSLHRAPPRRLEFPRPTAHVLHEFRLALNAGDLAAANEAIQFLRTNLRLDALNLHFLEVQRDAEFQQWEELHFQPFLRSLFFTRRPPRVTAALAEALYRTSFLQFELSDDPLGAVEQFRHSFQHECGTLFSVCPPSSRSAVAKMFLVAAAAGNPADRRLIDEIMQQAEHWPQSEIEFIRGLAALLPAEQPGSTLAPLEGVQRELEVAKDLREPPTVQRARAVLLGAVEIQTLEAYRIAVEYVNRLTSADRDTLTAAPGFESIWHALSHYAGEKSVPKSWQEWAERLPELHFTEARACAEQAIDEWPIVEQLRSPAEVEALSDALGQAWQAAEDRLYSALPHLVTWIQQDERWPNPDYRLLYERLLELLLLGANQSSATLGALVTLLHGAVSLGMDRATYRRVWEDIRSLVPELASVRSIDWLLDLAELTVVYPCSDPDLRGGVWSQINIALYQFRSRLTPEQSALAADIAATVGLTETFPTPQKSQEASELRLTERVSHFRLIAIYTLTESVGKRVQRILAAMYPGLRVEILHDVVATPRLQQLARNADIFVVCWTAAKHAAMSAIQQRRSSSQLTLFAPGGGSSSIIRTVLYQLQQQAV
ncbi:hypothetical protein NKDENANG_00364 [Candidatus Entotheonellaceae bacterium PAL068K]